MESNTLRVEVVKHILKKIEEVYAMAIELGVDCGVVSRINSTANVIEPYFIVDLVQRKLGVEISKKSRTRGVAEARQVAAHLLNKYSRLSLQRIAQYINVADHSGVIYHLNKINGHLKYDERLQVLIAAFDKDITEFYEKKNLDESNGI
jgi:chromosomal replication initiator protein